MALDLLSGLGPETGVMISGLIRVIAYALGAVITTVVVGFVLVIKKNKKMYNIPVTIWIPRSDGKIVDEFSATGGYFKSKAVQGTTSFRLKRKGVSTLEIPPPSSRFLVGLNRKLYLIQKGMDDFEPVLPDSFKYVQTEDVDGEGNYKTMAAINLKCVNQDATAWAEDNRNNAIRRFTISNIWEKYKDFIQMTIFIFIVFLAIYIMWQSMHELVTELARLVDMLTKATSGGISVS